MLWGQLPETQGSVTVKRVPVFTCTAAVPGMFQGDLKMPETQCARGTPHFHPSALQNQDACSVCPGCSHGLSPDLEGARRPGPAPAVAGAILLGFQPLFLSGPSGQAPSAVSGCDFPREPKEQPGQSTGHQGHPLGIQDICALSRAEAAQSYFSCTPTDTWAHGFDNAGLEGVAHVFSGGNFSLCYPLPLEGAWHLCPVASFVSPHFSWCARDAWKLGACPWRHGWVWMPQNHPWIKPVNCR